MAQTLLAGCLYELHAGGVTDEYVGVGAQSDGGYPRIYSNWVQRLNEFLVACLRYGVDVIILGGDNVDNTAVDKEATWTAILAQIYSVVGDAHVVPLMGNHERATVGDGTLTVLEWNTIWADSNLNTSYAAVVTGLGSSYPNNVASKKFCAYMYNINADFGIVVLPGFLKATGGEGFDHWDSDIQDYDGTDDAIVSLLEWLEDEGLNPAVNLMGRHRVVLNHYPMTKVDQNLNLPDKILDGVPDDGKDPIQTQFTAFVAATAPVTAITGHYHVKRVDIPQYMLNTIGGANYIHLGGSVLGKRLGDLRGNEFSIIKIDKDIGPVSINTFQYGDTSRDRYNLNDIDHIMGTQRRGRRR